MRLPLYEQLAILLFGVVVGVYLHARYIKRRIRKMSLSKRLINSTIKHP